MAEKIDPHDQQKLLKELREAESAHYRQCKRNKTAACYTRYKSNDMTSGRTL